MRLFNFFSKRRKKSEGILNENFYLLDNKNGQDAVACYDIDGDREYFIVNVSKFDNHVDRSGSETDVNLLRWAFTRRNFHPIMEPLVGRVSYKDLENALTSYVESQGKPKLFAIAIMTHGKDNDYIEFSDGHCVSIYKVLEPLFKKSKLNGVPKLIIGQFCRGRALISTSLDIDCSDRPETETHKQLNTMYFFATANGTPAARSSTRGSPFIGHFCQSFCDENNIWKISISINKKMAQEKLQINYERQLCKLYQVPFCNHSFTKDLIFENCDPKTSNLTSKSEKGK